MPMPSLQIVTQNAPFIGFCEACKAQFRSYNRDKAEAERIIRAQFEAHECQEESSRDLKCPGSHLTDRLE